MNIDSVVCYAAHHGGATEEVLPEPMRIYHIEHRTGSGWLPEGQARLFARTQAGFHTNATRYPRGSSLADTLTRDFFNVRTLAHVGPWAALDSKRFQRSLSKKPAGRG
jgi:hypothetical protein